MIYNYLDRPSMAGIGLWLVLWLSACDAQVFQLKDFKVGNELKVRESGEKNNFAGNQLVPSALKYFFPVFHVEPSICLSN